MTTSKNKSCGLEILECPVVVWWWELLYSNLNTTLYFEFNLLFPLGYHFVSRIQDAEASMCRVARRAAVKLPGRG